MKKSQERLVVVSNRLPVSAKQDESGAWKLAPGDGGLVTALSPVLKQRQGVWIGWTGADVDLESIDLGENGHTLPDFEVVGLPLSAAEINLYYKGFSNEIIWPLFHDFRWLCNFDPNFWPVYQAVNEKFADTIESNVRKDDFIWVHDYHLMLVANALRRKNVQSRLGFFLHIPFPAEDGFSSLPWRQELLEALLDYDLIGFQTQHDLNNFIRCVKTMIQGAHIEGEAPMVNIHAKERVIRAGAFPISIDYDTLSQQARTEEVRTQSRYLRRKLGPQQLMLGIDRLDYTKGIPGRLQAFAEALTSFPDILKRITFVQIIVPSRTDVARYQTLKEEIERLVGQINGKFSQPGWTPVQYMYRNLNKNELLAYYRCADIGLVTPLKDGMNLVAKEYCACNVDKRGALILSEFAGAAAELYRQALLVNPFDIKAVASAIFNAFSMSKEERSKRMSGLRQTVRRHNVFHWVESFLMAAATESLRDLGKMIRKPVPTHPVFTP